MEKPSIPDDNRVAVELKKADEQISQGIETQVNELFILNPIKRSYEFLFFGIVYLIGAIAVSQFEGNWVLTLFGIIFMGIALNSLVIFMHEGLHGLLANNHRLNHLMTFLVGLPLMVSATAFYTTHVNHHYEIGRKSDYATYRQHTRKSVFVWIAYFLQLAIGSFLYITLIPFLGFKDASKKSRVKIVAEYILIMSAFTVFFTQVSTANILLYWLYPAFVLNILSNVRGLASHSLGDVENLYLSSRTVKGSKFITTIFMNENHHLEHHIFPRTPSYNLRAMHALIWDRLPQAMYSESYPRFLFGMIKAAIRQDLSPMGVVNPMKNTQNSLMLK